MENPNCAYFRKNFFCRKNENIMQTVRDIKTLDKNLCFALTEKIREKEPKNCDEHIAKNVRNVGKIRFYEKISIE